MAVFDGIDIDHSPMVTLAGELDSDGCERITDVLEGLLESGYNAPQMDFTGVRSMDTEGLLALLRWCNQFNEKFEVVSVNPLVKRLFEIAGCSDIVHHSEEHNIPPYQARQPITDCLAIANDYELHSFSVAGQLDSCKIVRDRITETAARMHFSADELGDIKLAVGEAISNAIRHGCHENPEMRITIRTLATADKLVIELTDYGPGFDPDNVMSLLSDLPEGGMGIRCMRHSMDEVTFSFAQGTTVRMIKLIKH